MYNFCTYSQLLCGWKKSSTSKYPVPKKHFHFKIHHFGVIQTSASQKNIEEKSSK